MQTTVSKSQFKPQALEYLRLVEKNKIPLIITHGGKPVVQITPYSADPLKDLKSLRGTIKKYKDPYKPVGLNDWEILK